MNPRIQQILAMSKAGTLTDEQAAQLIEETLKAERPPRPRAAAPAGGDEAEPLGAVWHKAVSRSVAAIVDRAQAFHGTAPDGHGNVVQLSHVDYPAGDGALFAGNQIRMAKLHELDLERSEMTDNRFDASKVDEVRLRDARLAQNHFNASSVEELALDHSDVRGLELFSCKWSEVTLKEDSAIEDVRMHASVVKEVELAGGSRWADSAVNSSVLTEVSLRGSRLAGSRMDEVRLNEIQIEGSEWNGVVMRGLGFDRVDFVGCRFEDAVFAARQGRFKKWAWSKTRFENCRLDRVLFSDCRTHHTVIRGVTLQDAQFRGADLSGLTLEGNEAFLGAVGARRP